MGFETAKFGDGSASGGGNVTTQVTQHYGERESKFAKGNVKTEGFTETLSINFDFNETTADELLLVNPIIPVGARIVKAELITKVQGVAGTSAVVDIGTSGSEATNGFTITEAQLEAAAGTVVDLTGALSGTWDAEAKLAAATEVNIALTVEANTAGEWEAEITYVLARAG